MFLQGNSHPRRSSGFTLIELMFVVAIVAILLALAYPSYLDSVRKSRRADAKATLMDRAQSLERCFTRFNAYNDGNCPNPVGASEKGFYTVTVDRTATTWTLTATPAGDQANDACGTFTVDYLGNKTPTPGALRCWGSS
jgi:type IV pilus assembly protein PilE